MSLIEKTNVLFFLPLCPLTNMILVSGCMMICDFNFSLTTLQSDRCKYLGMLTLGVLWVAPKWQLFRNQKKNSQVSTSSFAFISSTMKVLINLRIVLSILREARILPLKQEHSIGDTFIKNKNKKMKTTQAVLTCSLTLRN